MNVALLGATGIVGQQFIRMLDHHPYFELTVLIASSRTAGKKYKACVNWLLGDDIPPFARDMIVEPIDIKRLRSNNIAVAFSALPADVAKKVEKRCAKEGISVFSNSRTHRMDMDVPILVPEINAEHLEIIEYQKKKNKGFIVTNPNCTTAGVVMPLKPLVPFGIKSVTVSSYQALSGAGYPGVPSLDATANIVPFIEDEEEKVEQETKKILGIFRKNRIENASFEITATCMRVPVRDGHIVTIVVELEDNVPLVEIRNALTQFTGIPQKLKLPTAPDRPLIVRDEENRPQPILDANAGTPERARGMAVTVGRLAKKGKKIRLVSLVHNTVRGAAGASILNAELARNRGYI